LVVFNDAAVVDDENHVAISMSILILFFLESLGDIKCNLTQNSTNIHYILFSLAIVKKVSNNTKIS